MTPTFGLQCSTAANQEASSNNRKAYFKEVEGFLQRALGLYAHKFPKSRRALLTIF